MKKLAFYVLALLLLSALAACGSAQNAADVIEPVSPAPSKYRLAEIAADPEHEPISNTIPDWVGTAKDERPLYVLNTLDISDFDRFALEDFPTSSDPEWTQEQSDRVYLGQGIPMYWMGGTEPEAQQVCYPILLDGTIVSCLKVHRFSSGELGAQLAPYFVNEWNALRGLTSAETPMILGVNNANVIAVIGTEYYVLDIDHVYFQQPDPTRIPEFPIGTDSAINAAEPLCTERRANVSDWTTVSLPGADVQ